MEFGAYLGYELLPANGDALPACTMTIDERHLSTVGVVHGGVIYSLMDYAFGATLWGELLDETQACSTVNIDIHYLAPVTIGSTLTVQPVCVHRGRTLARMEGKVTDQDGNVVAFATGAFNIYRHKSRFERAIQLIDALHREDPDQEELLYAERMTAWLERLEPEASNDLKLAARAQHLCRWRIPRSDYPEGRAGYKQWRKDEQKMHAALAADCLRKARYPEDRIARVQFLIQKKKLKVDAETQTLEDVACLVFLEHYFAPFAVKYPHDKMVDIVHKTWLKMSDRGHQAALSLSLPPHLEKIVTDALNL